MSPSISSSLLVYISCLFLISSSVTTISAHNITRILDKFPEFKTFNELLTRTHLATQINNRKTITILAVPDDNIGDLAGKPEDVIKEILMTHVVLDYYDILKLQKMKGKSSILTTMFQTTGTASYQQGFLNVTEDKKTEQVIFGSAIKGSQRNVHYLGTVTSLPFNISVLSVSGPIIAPGIGGQTLRPIASPPKKAPSPKLPPSPSSAAPAPAPGPVADSPLADSPLADSPDADSPTPSPSNMDADAPASEDAPASSPDADAPGSEEATADNARSFAMRKNLASGGSMVFGLLLALACFV